MSMKLMAERDDLNKVNKELSIEITRLKEQQVYQEPIGFTSKKWIDSVSDYCSGVYWKNSNTYLDEEYVIPLYTSPQTKEYAPLTDDEIDDCANKYSDEHDNIPVDSWYDFARDIENILKNKGKNDA